MMMYNTMCNADLGTVTVPKNGETTVFYAAHKRGQIAVAVQHHLDDGKIKIKTHPETQDYTLNKGEPVLFVTAGPVEKVILASASDRVRCVVEVVSLGVTDDED